MKTGSVMVLVGLNCPEEEDEVFNKWWDEHLKIALRFPGLKAVKRYKIAEDSDFNSKTYSGYQNYPTYMASYEFASENDLQAYQNSGVRKDVFKQTSNFWPEGAPYEKKWRVVYKVIRSWRQSTKKG